MRGSSFSRVYRVPLRRPRLSVGRGLRNDVILLVSGIDDVSGTVEKRGRSVVWSPRQGEAMDCSRRAVRIGPYEMRARNGGIVRYLFGFFVTTVCAAIVISHVLPPKKVVAFHSKQARPIPLPARGVYGRMSDEAPPFERAAFQFDYSGKEGVLLHYVPGRVRSSDQLVIELNGSPVGFVTSASNDWGIEQRLLLPQRQLKFGANRLSFSLGSSRLDPGRWGIRDVYVTAVPSDWAFGEDGNSLYEVAERVFKEGGSSPGQLARAQQLIDRALSRFKAEEGKVPRKAVLLRREIVEGQNTLFSRLMAEARGALSLGDRKGARAVFSRLLSELTDPVDPRRIEVVRALEELPR